MSFVSQLAMNGRVQSQNQKTVYILVIAAM